MAERRSSELKRPLELDYRRSEGLQESSISSGGSSFHGIWPMGNSYEYVAVPEPSIDIPIVEQTIYQRQRQWKGLDFDPLESAASIEEERVVTKRQFKLMELSSWITSFWIGLGTAVVAWMIDFFIKKIVILKFDIIIGPYVRFGQPHWIAAVLYIVLNIMLVGIASGFVVSIETVAAGSGIPEIKAELNGVKVPRVLKLKTLVVKATGVLFSVAAGMPIGKEGPMIHTGSILGSNLSQGGSWTLGFKSLVSINERFRCDNKKRDFVGVGAAAGVSAAFGAPIGGVLFAIEEGASFWSIPLTWRAFLASVTATYVLNLLISATDPPRKGVSIVVLDNPGVVEFGDFGTDAQTPWTLYELPLFALLGAFVGVLGALFNHINYKLTQFRMRYIPVTNGARRWLEVCFMSFCVSVVGVGIPMLFPLASVCHSTAQVGENSKVVKSLQTFYCQEGFFNQAGTLFFNQSESAILQLFHSPFQFSPPLLLLFFVCYYLLACCTYGTAIPSGLFVPSLTAGAAFGRFYGEILRLITNGGLSPAGSYSLMGAAAMLGGMARITISAVVIIVESTQNVSYALPVSLTIMVAKWVADLFNHGLYDIHNHIKGIPFLESDAPQECRLLVVKDLLPQLPPVIALPLRGRVADFLAILRAHPYSAFPIISSSFGIVNRLDPPTLLGMIRRDEVCSLLKLKAYSKTGNEASPLLAKDLEILRPDDVIAEAIIRQDYPDMAELKDVNIPNEDLNAWFDLTPYFCPCPVTMREVAPLTRVYRIFRLMGIRHLPIVDVHNRILAVLTRKHLTEAGVEHVYHQFVHDRVKQKPEDQI